MKHRTLYLENAPDETPEKIRKLFASVEIEVKWADSEGSAELSLFWPDGKQESEENRLYSGGFMTCVTAFKVAGGIGMDRAAFGELLNTLDIKLRNCQLGCF